LRGEPTRPVSAHPSPRSRLVPPPSRIPGTLSLQVRAIPVRKDDEVKVVRGDFKGREGKVLAVYRKKFVIHVERVTVDKANGAPAQAGIHPSNVVITKLKIDNDRKALLERKAAGRKQRAAAGSGMNDVDA
jgi:large subunit ribosomal protein L26e